MSDSSDDVTIQEAARVLDELLRCRAEGEEVVEPLTHDTDRLALPGIATNPSGFPKRFARWVDDIRRSVVSPADHLGKLPNVDFHDVPHLTPAENVTSPAGARTAYEQRVAVIDRWISELQAATSS